MSFESRQPQPLAFASVSQLDFGPVPWNQSSDWKAFTLQSPIDPPVFDTFQASSLRGLIEIKSGQSETISVRIAPKAEQILGSFHDEVRVTFYKKKKKQLGCLRFPVQFKSIGDLELSPSFLWGNKAALEKGQEISLQIISSQEKPLEYLGLQSNLQHLNERWEDQGQGRYRFTCTVKSAAATAVKETLTLTFKTASGTITRPVQIVFK